MLQVALPNDLERDTNSNLYRFLRWRKIEILDLRGQREQFVRPDRNAKTRRELQIGLASAKCQQQARAVLLNAGKSRGAALGPT